MISDDGGNRMVECNDVSFSYPADSSGGCERASNEKGGALRHISCRIEDGSFVLLCGESGCGKTTLTRLFNGLIPHYYEGKFTGAVCLDGEDTGKLSLFDISEKVGSVFQNPRSQFFNVDTTSELAFGPENHGLPEETVRKRVKEVSGRLRLGDLLDRSIFSLSGGEKQKIACGSASAIEPDLFVLDEPSSNLDASAIEDLRKLLTILKAQGKTIVISEHRLYYLRELIDRVLYLKDGEIQGDYTAEEFRSIPEEERARMGLRPLDLNSLMAAGDRQIRTGGSVWQLKNFTFAHKHQPVILNIERASFPSGSATAVIGQNGAGKSTLSRCLCGLERRCRGIVEHEGKEYSQRMRLKLCYMVMQDVNHQLFTESVMDEILLSMEKEDIKKAEKILKETDLLPLRDCHPLGLSGGQKQRVAVASAIASERPVILFDEPTSGLDLFHMRQMADVVNRITENGKTVIVVTHDPEFILRCCDYVLHMENGEVKESYSLKSREERRRLLGFFRECTDCREFFSRRSVQSHAASTEPAQTRG